VTPIKESEMMAFASLSFENEVVTEEEGASVSQANKKIVSVYV
jgi:hypothetical protein